MKSKLVIALFLISMQAVYAQQPARELLNGQILADSLGVDRINITNISTKRVAVSDSEGYFNLYAREKDTLVFSGVSFEPKRMILKKSDFMVNILYVRLTAFVNPLDEVIIREHPLTGNLNSDQGNIKVTMLQPIDVALALDTQFEDDTKSSPDNTLMPGYVDTKYMPDFIKIGRRLMKPLFKKKNSNPKTVFISQNLFADVVREKFPESFFVTTLGLKPEDIGLFLSYCENEPGVRSLLDPNKEFALINFLIAKSNEYKKFRKE